MQLNRRDLLTTLGAVATTSVVGRAADSAAARTMSGALAHSALNPSGGFPRKEDFAIPAGTAYFNGATIHPVPKVVVAAVERGLQSRATGASVPSVFGGGARPVPKGTFAELINAKPSEIAYIPNTSTGENLVVSGLGLDRNYSGNVVTDALHFEGALVHLYELQKQGLDLRVVMPREGRIEMSALERLIDRETKLVEVSAVASFNGFQHDLKAVCDLAHAHGAYVYADIIQSVGAVPLDVRATGLDFAACSGFKWLMADFGLGFLYVREELLGTAVQRSQIGYFSGSVETHDSPLDPDSKTTPISWTLGRDASSYFEVGSMGGNVAGAFAYKASLAYIQALGVENIQAHRQPLLRRLEREVPKLGYPLLTPPGGTSPIITFATTDGALVQRKLAAAKVAARVSKYWFRFSPSVYNDMADVEQALAGLA